MKWSNEESVALTVWIVDTNHCLGGDNPKKCKFAAQRQLLQKPVHFTGAMTAEMADLIPLINQGMDKSEVRVIVVSYDDALGADFWPKCAVLSTHIPQTLEALEQIVGRGT